MYTIFRYRKLPENTELNAHKTFLENKLEDEFEEALKNIDKLEEVCLFPLI